MINIDKDSKSSFQSGEISAILQREAEFDRPKPVPFPNQLDADEVSPLNVFDDSKAKHDESQLRVIELELEKERLRSQLDKQKMAVVVSKADVIFAAKLGESKSLQWTVENQSSELWP